MNFGEAFEQVKKGSAMKLPHWGEDVTIRAHYPQPGELVTAPYLYVTSRYGVTPWRETMVELFSEEWVVVP